MDPSASASSCDQCVRFVLFSNYCLDIACTRERNVALCRMVFCDSTAFLIVQQCFLHLCLSFILLLSLDEL